MIDNQTNFKINCPKYNSKSSGKIKKSLNKIWCQEKNLFGHSGKITCITSSSFYKIFASGSTDGSIRLWDSESHRPISAFSGKFGGINCISFDRKFGNLFSGGEDMQIKCWDIEKQKVSRKFKGHFSSVTGLDVHPLLNILVSGGRDCTTRIWDMRIKKEIKVLDVHTNAISSVLVSEQSPHLVTSSLDRTICLWDLVLDNIVGHLFSHKHGIREMKRNSSEFIFASMSPDSILIWRSDGTLLKKISSSKNQNCCFAFNKIDEMVVSTFSGWLKFYNLNKPRKNSPVSSSLQKSYALCSKHISTIHFSIDGKELILGKKDNSIEIFKKRWRQMEFSP